MNYFHQWDCRNGASILPVAWQFLTKMKAWHIIQQSLLSICPRVMKTIVHTKFCIMIIAVALFVIAPKLDMARMPLSGQMVKHIWCICTVGCHSPIERNSYNHLGALWGMQWLEKLVLKVTHDRTPLTWYYGKRELCKWREISGHQD